MCAPWYVCAMTLCHISLPLHLAHDLMSPIMCRTCVWYVWHLICITHDLMSPHPSPQTLCHLIHHLMFTHDLMSPIMCRTCVWYVWHLICITHDLMSPHPSPHPSPHVDTCEHVSLICATSFNIFCMWEQHVSLICVRMFRGHVWHHALYLCDMTPFRHKTHWWHTMCTHCVAFCVITVWWHTMCL